MVVVTNEHELTINFNLTVDYDTGNVALEQVDTLEDSTDTNLDDYIDAFKCDGDQFDASTTAHLENTQLNICIKSESTDVVIDKIQTMVSRSLWQSVPCPVMRILSIALIDSPNNYLIIQPDHYPGGQRC